MSPALVLIVAALPTQAQSGLALSPMRVELNLAPGSQRTGLLSIGNSSAERGHFRTEILDVFIDQEGVPQFEENVASEEGFSCKNWLTVNPMEADVPGLREMSIRYTFQIPPGVLPRTYHCALGFTSLPDPRKRQAPFGIVALLRLTSTFYITVGNPDPAGEVKQISIEKVEGPTLRDYRAVISVENSGLANLRGVGNMEVLNESGDVLQTSEFPSIVILPSRTQRLPVMLSKNLQDGAYTVHIRVNLGNGEIQDIEQRFQLPAKKE